MLMQQILNMKTTPATITLYRQQGIGEEIANSISHGAGFIAAAIITPILILTAIPRGTIAMIGASVFGATMMTLYLASALFHACTPGRMKRIFQTIDHSAIFLLIAGTYTPFTLTVVNQSTLGWTLFVLVWSFAILGVIYKTFGPLGIGKLSIALYLAMGWLTVMAMQPSWNKMPGWGLFWFVSGALLYTGGVFFFVYDHKNQYNHFIWHVFTLCGTVCHAVTILGFVY